MGDFVMTLSTFLVSWGWSTCRYCCWRRMPGSIFGSTTEIARRLGSIWYVLSLAGHPVPYLNWISGGAVPASAVSAS
jgi:hypothetical protein